LVRGCKTFGFAREKLRFSIGYPQPPGLNYVFFSGGCGGDGAGRVLLFWRGLLAPTTPRRVCEASGFAMEKLRFSLIIAILSRFPPDP